MVSGVFGAARFPASSALNRPGNGARRRRKRNEVQGAGAELVEVGANDLAAWWMLGMTALIVTLTFFRGGLRRWEGVAVIAIYLAFVVLW